MRIRKGQRCLPLPPAGRSVMQERSAQPGKEVDAMEGPKEAIVVAPDVADITIGGRQYQDRAKDTSMERNTCSAYDLEKNRVSAVNVECSLMIRDIGADATVTKAPSEGETLFTRHNMQLDMTGANAGNATLVIETRDKLDLLEQSLRHVCSSVGMSGLSACDAVSRMIEQNLPGLNGDEKVNIEQVAKIFRNSSNFVECEEQLGRYILQDSPAVGEENKSFVAEASEISHEKTRSSSDMVEVANELQNMQKGQCSHSLGSSVIVELSEAASIHASDEKAVNISKEFVKQSEGGIVNEDVPAMNQKASSSQARFRSQKAMQMGQNVSRCKRDDGKGWRCSQPAEEGFNMCSHHRKRPISEGQYRRKRGRKDSEQPAVSSERSSAEDLVRHVANARAFPDIDIAPGLWSPFLDEELAHDEYRHFLKAKSIKSVLSKQPKSNLHTKRAK